PADELLRAGDQPAAGRPSPRDAREDQRHVPRRGGHLAPVRRADRRADRPRDERPHRTLDQRDPRPGPAAGPPALRRPARPAPLPRRRPITPRAVGPSRVPPLFPRLEPLLDVAVERRGVRLRDDLLVLGVTLLGLALPEGGAGLAEGVAG